MSGSLPDQRVRWPVTRQTWADLTFLHWRVEPSVLQPLLPERLRVDVVDGSAWVGVTPFEMKGVRLPGLPAVPGWSRFPEVNVRTYVRGPDGRDGLWFFSLVCPRRGVVSALRAIGLPYVRADGEATHAGAHHEYRFQRRWMSPPGSLFAAQVQVGSALRDGERTELVDSLTGRWNAYVERAGRLLRVPVEHEPWPLHHASVGAGTWRLSTAVLPAARDEPMVHFSPGVHSRIGAPVLV